MPDNTAALALLDAWYATPATQLPEYWDTLAAELAAHRFTLRREDESMPEDINAIEAALAQAHAWRAEVREELQAAEDAVWRAQDALDTARRQAGEAG